MPKFGTKNAFFGYFWARILKKLLYYRKSEPLNCLIAKFPGKAKIPTFGTKNALFGYFWTKI